MSVVRMDDVLFQMAKYYHKLHLKDHPDSNADQGVIVMSTLIALEANGFATKHVDADGSVTWKATPKFLVNFKGGAGPLVVFATGVH